MKKRINIVLIICFSISLAIVIIHKSSPFGLVFNLSVSSVLITLVTLLGSIGIHLIKKHLILKIAGYLLLVLTIIASFIFAVGLYDYRILLHKFPYGKLNEKQWREDLDFLRSTMNEHPAMTDSLISIVNSKIENLKNRDDENRNIQLLNLSKVIAMVPDGHTYLLPFQPYSRSKFLPLMGYYFDDGFYIVNAAHNYRDLIGDRIMAINDRSIEKLFKDFKSIFGPDNDFNAKHMFSYYVFATWFINPDFDQNLYNVRVAIDGASEVQQVKPSGLLP